MKNLADLADMCPTMQKCHLLHGEEDRNPPRPVGQSVQLVPCSIRPETAPVPPSDPLKTADATVQWDNLIEIV